MKEITTTQLKDRLVSGEEILLVDIRETDEYRDWHIHGSSNVPIYNAISQGDETTVARELSTLPKDRPVVAVCRMGVTSAMAARFLESNGYDASSLAGGIRSWSNAWTEAHIPVAPGGARILQIRRNGKGCLSYMVCSDGHGAVVDACLDPEVYTSIGEREGVKIDYVIETHVHADHISRARALSDACGAKLAIQKNDRAKFDYEPLSDGQALTIGETQMRVLATPGHTLESVCLNLDDTVLLSGDTLFTENIGRPDLEKGDAGAEEGARLLYESLHDKLLKLPTSILVCPGHTSAPIGFDGEPIADTLGNITPKIDLLLIDKDEFVKTVPGLLGNKPPNFERVLSINEGRADLGWLDPLELEAGPNRCAVGKNG